MLYSILIYDSEDMVGALSREEDDAIMAEHLAVHEKLAAKGRLGPVARLMPTTTATTVRPGHDPLVVDGPYAETKEHMGGFWIISVADLDEALEWARKASVACERPIEVRPTENG